MSSAALALPTPLSPERSALLAQLAAGADASGLLWASGYLAGLARSLDAEWVVVTVRGDREFEWRGEIYRSLSAVAKAVTGSHCSGVAFFGLSKKGGSR